MVNGCGSRTNHPFYWLCIDDGNTWAKKGELYGFNQPWILSEEDRAVGPDWMKKNGASCGYLDVSGSSKWEAVCRDCLVKNGFIW